jgi:hypothetical protein
MKRQALSILQSKFFSAIRAVKQGRKIFTTYVPQDEAPPYHQVLEIQAVTSENQTTDLDEQRINMVIDQWSQSSENTEVVDLLDECMTAVCSGLDLTSDNFLLVDATITQYGVKTEDLGVFGIWQHGTVKASFEVVDTTA